jgi:hypothetical protein
MRLFECQACGQALYFENVLCESCGRKLGYLPNLATLSALEPAGEKWRALADGGAPYRYCANVAHESCNWLIADDGDEPFCLACRHNRTIPNQRGAGELAGMFFGSKRRTGPPGLLSFGACAFIGGPLSRLNREAGAISDGPCEFSGNEPGSKRGACVFTGALRGSKRPSC